MGNGMQVISINPVPKIWIALAVLLSSCSQATVNLTQQKTQVDVSPTINSLWCLPCLRSFYLTPSHIPFSRPDFIPTDHSRFSRGVPSLQEAFLTAFSLSFFLLQHLAIFLLMICFPPLPPLTNFSSLTARITPHLLVAPALSMVAGYLTMPGYCSKCNQNGPPLRKLGIWIWCISGCLVWFVIQIQVS